MIINITKFGTVFISRQDGKNDYTAFLPTLENIDEHEDILVDFEGVSTFSPSWGDEFLTPLQKKFGDRLSLKNTSNPSVALTIETLEKINGSEFKKT
ncbi:MAG: DUF4325 domain-containing protein [Patescibacteria group bacterium]